ncbi:hypothetical protein [Nostoc sp.]
MESWHELAIAYAIAVMRLKPNKLPHFHKGLRAMNLIQSAL